MMTGRTIAHYQVLEKLGEGGMGVVYKARDTHLDRFVALKVLPPEKVADPERKRRFVQEAKAASALNHPNIITIYDIDQADGVDYIAMEYVSGRSLAQLVAGKGLSVNEALKYAVQTADALAAAHQTGIIHRDVKPANIMVTDKGLVKVLDFGLAKLTEADIDATQTQEGAVVGTIAYMSPEQAEGQKIDARSDIFSFGAVLYEMLTGRRAFQRGSSLSTLRAIVHEEPAPFSGEVPAELQRVISRCLRKPPGERYQHTADLKLALEEALRPATAPASIAVLPFANLSADKENEYFSDGLAEEILNALTKVPGLRVTARTSSFAFRGKELDVREIGARLNVAHILEGSVRKAGNRIRVTAQLIQAHDGYHLWSERYDREMTDVFAIQDEISEAIVDHLRVHLAGERPRVQQYTANLEAYDAYIQGLYQWNKYNQDGFRKAAECFQLAIQKDPRYASAWAKLALSYAMLGFWGFRPLSEVLPQAEQAARRALDLDDALAEAHLALGTACWFYHWDLAASEREYRRAVELGPNDPLAHCVLSVFLGSMKRDDPAAAAEAELAQELDPLSVPAKQDAGWVYYWARQYDRAIAQSRAVLAMDENCLQAHYIQGLALQAKSSLDEAIVAFERAAALCGDSMSLAYLGGACGFGGQHERARVILGQLQERARSQQVRSICFALVHAGLGENDQALQWLEKARQERDPHVLWLGVSPGWDCMRGDPRFTALLRKLNLEP